MADPTTSPEPPRVIRRRRVRELLGGISEPTLWRMERDGLFPKGFRIGKRWVGYDAAAVEEAIRARTSRVA